MLTERWFREAIRALERRRDEIDNEIARLTRERDGGEQQSATTSSVAQNRATLKVPEAAEIAGTGERSIRNAITEGRIPHLRFGRNIVIPREPFLRWLNSAGRTPQVQTRGMLRGVYGEDAS